MSLLSSYPQRNTANLYEILRDKRTFFASEIIVVEVRVEREPNSKIRTLMKGRATDAKHKNVQNV